MRIAAYILAADPAWIEASVLSYYDHVDRIVVSFDENRTSWTGTPLGVDECLARLRAIDRDSKMEYCPGHYARLDHKPMDNETYQRQCALKVAGQDADWVLQLDTDEILPDGAGFVRRLREEIPVESDAVDWPMRTFFQKTKEGKFLEVASLTRRQVSAYPGPVAVRPRAVLAHARQIEGKRWRYDIRTCDTDPAAGTRPVHGVIPQDDAIIHLSWVRSDQEIEDKLRSWGHNGGFDWRRYMNHVWRVAPRRWRFTFRFHPFEPAWWPALRSVDLPAHLIGPSMEGQ
jgi:hypothetical protein